jgi:hypothetical protein
MFFLLPDWSLYRLVEDLEVDSVSNSSHTMQMKWKYLNNPTWTCKTNMFSLKTSPKQRIQICCGHHSPPYVNSAYAFVTSAPGHAAILGCLGLLDHVVECFSPIVSVLVPAASSYNLWCLATGRRLSFRSGLLRAFRREIAPLHLVDVLTALLLSLRICWRCRRRLCVHVWNHESVPVYAASARVWSSLSWCSRLMWLLISCYGSVSMCCFV